MHLENMCLFTIKLYIFVFFYTILCRLKAIGRHSTNGAITVKWRDNPQ